jgi:hypothetical protein
VFDQAERDVTGVTAFSMCRRVDMLTTDQVVPADYPELAQLAWNRDVRRPISGAEALALYERNWRMVRSEALTPGEAALIRTLAERHGAGFLLT